MKVFFISIISLLVISCNNSKDNRTNDAEPKKIKESILKKTFLNRPHYSFQYYQDWKIDSTDTDYDIDSNFSLDAPVESGFVTFFLFNTDIDPKEQVDAQVKAHLNKTMKDGAVSYFNSWGSYRGFGATIKGKLLGIFKGEITVFSYSTDSTSFLIASEYSYEDEEKVAPGLKLIESSFKIK